MRRRLIFSMLIAVLLMSPNGALAKTFSITVTGDPGASFVGSCLAKKEDGDHQVLALNGKVPFEQHIDADFVSCRFNASGRIRIEATSDVGQHREAETKNGVVTLSLR